MEFFRKKWDKLIYIRIGVFLFGLIIFSLGIATTINVQYLGLNPWDVLNVGLYESVGLTIGSWNIITGLILVCIALILDRSYVKLGTFINVIVIGTLVDLYLYLDFLPKATNGVFDYFLMLIGIVIMGVGGGVYNAAKLGSGPRDGFILSISDKTGLSIGKVRIILESSVLIIGYFIGGPLFIFSILFTFILSPIFQFVYLRATNTLDRIEKKMVVKG